MLGSQGQLFSELTWSTVNSFKGLENEYIILIEGENIVLTEWHRILLYVALTRTKTEFHYMGNDKDNIWQELLNA